MVNSGHLKIGWHKHIITDDTADQWQHMHHAAPRVGVLALAIRLTPSSKFGLIVSTLRNRHFLRTHVVSYLISLGAAFVAIYLRYGSAGKLGKYRKDYRDNLAQGNRCCRRVCTSSYGGA